VKLFLLDALQELESNPYAKLILYEPKREFYAWLSSLGLKSKITYFMPSDTRSVALDFMADYSDEKDADTLAHAFYPERPSQQESSFWGESLRAIFAGVFTAIRARLDHADLRLVCLVLEDEELTRKVLSFDPYLVQARKLTAVTGKSVDETARNIQHTIQARIGKMKVLAAHLDCAARERPLFSLRRFIKEPRGGIFVISKDDDYGKWQDPMNGVLFLRFTQLLEKEQKDPRRKIFVVIDEFPTLCGDDRCPGVKNMFLRLRSRGAVPLITDQGLTTLKPIYEGDTTAILGQCSNVLILRQPDIESAEDAAKTLGVERGYEKKASLSYGGEYATVSMNQHWYDRPIVSPSVLQDLFMASKKRGIEGWAKSALYEEKKPWPVTIEPEVVDKIPPTDSNILEYDERKPGTQRLRQLEDDEREALLGDAPHARGRETQATPEDIIG
jgi:type IV secretory pathway TraG/TraD family ATPase VirD4